MARSPRRLLCSMGVRRGLALVVSMLIALAFLEVGVRLLVFGGLREPRTEAELREPHPTRGWALAARKRAVAETVDYAVEVVINDHGLRDVEHAYERPARVRRIVVLGDSFMEAYQVPLASSLPRRLESLLHGVEVINLGVGGYGTTQELIALQEEGLKYAPDLVLLGFYYNDLHNNSRTLEQWLWKEETLKVFGRPYARIAPDGRLNIEAPDYERATSWAREARARTSVHRSKWGLPSRSLLYRRLAALAGGSRARPYDPNVWLGPLLAHYDPSWGDDLHSAEDYALAWEEAWSVTERLLEEVDRTSRSAGARFVLFTVPDRLQIEEPSRRPIEARYEGLVFAADALGRRLRAFCERSHIDFIDLAPAFRADASGEPLFHHRRDRHWNSRGHEVAARALAEELEGRL